MKIKQVNTGKVLVQCLHRVGAKCLLLCVHDFSFIHSSIHSSSFQSLLQSVSICSLRVHCAPGPCWNLPLPSLLWRISRGEPETLLQRGLVCPWLAVV